MGARTEERVDVLTAVFVLSSWAVGLYDDFLNVSVPSCNGRNIFYSAYAIFKGLTDT